MARRIQRKAKRQTARKATRKVARKTAKRKVARKSTTRRTSRKKLTLAQELKARKVERSRRLSRGGRVRVDERAQQAKLWGASFLFLGMFFVLLSRASVTGAVVGAPESLPKWFFLYGAVFFIGGLLVLRSRRRR